MSVEFSDKVYKELLSNAQTLREVNDQYNKIFGLISDLQIKDSTVARVKEDPIAVKTFAIAMPTRNRHGCVLSQTDVSQLYTPKGLKFLGIYTEFGKTYSDARNSIMNMILNQRIPVDGFPGLTKPIDYVLWLDDDVILPRNALEIFLSHQEPVVGGIYYYKKDETYPISRYWGHREGNEINKREIVYIDNEVQGVSPCDFMVPTGCLWVDLRKIQGLTLPWFRQSFPEEGCPDGYAYGEDRFFTEKLTMVGIKPICDKSIQCIHVDVNTNKYYGNPLYVEGNVLKPEAIDKFAIRRFRYIQ